ncbi:hypothetical protein LOK49_LG09G00773 [Camellia lanceoleosa]|uniref:Uncharacterized protein n=1 Tax=Camellia lanceoleosa TaxID=1840588 RepID=A0ACC0GGT5_9ERIC|nr:hypothetical protein LOK49_LG09G00773 [Camellia lanceoleosa]
MAGWENTKAESLYDDRENQVKQGQSIADSSIFRSFVDSQIQQNTVPKLEDLLGRESSLLVGYSHSTSSSTSSQSPPRSSRLHLLPPVSSRMSTQSLEVSTISRSPTQHWTKAAIGTPRNRKIRALAENTEGSWVDDESSGEEDAASSNVSVAFHSENGGHGGAFKL